MNYQIEKKIYKTLLVLLGGSSIATAIFVLTKLSSFLVGLLIIAFLLFWGMSAIGREVAKEYRRGWPTFIIVYTLSAGISYSFFALFYHSFSSFSFGF